MTVDIKYITVGKRYLVSPGTYSLESVREVKLLERSPAGRLKLQWLNGAVT